MVRICFDGDSYLLTLPPLDIMLGLARMERSGKYRIPFRETRKNEMFLMSHQPFHNQVLHSSVDIEHHLDYLANKKKLPVSNMAELKDGHWQCSMLSDFVTFGFRPCLIPLNKAGKPDKRAILGSEDGSLLTGGTFWHGCGMRDWEYPVLSNPHEPPFSESIFPIHSIKFRDSILDSGANLQWVYFDGFLVCTRILFAATIQDLEKCGLLDSDPDVQNEKQQRKY